MKKEIEHKEKKAVAQNEDERDVWVCIAIQKIGIASIKQICDWIDIKGGKISEKQAINTAEKLRARGLLSIDLTEKQNNISIKKYKMKSIKFHVPEVAQLKDISDNSDINPLKDELDRTKGTRKKGMKTFDYYIAEVTFITNDGIQGFIPDSEGIIRHYKNSNGEPILYHYHFKNWFRDNLPLINRASSAIGDIKFYDGIIELNGDIIKIVNNSNIIDKYITNTDSGFHSSQGTGGRGIKKIECLPDKSIIKTKFIIPRELINPDKFEKAINIICEYGSRFGGGHKLSTGKLKLDKLEIIGDELFPED